MRRFHPSFAMRPLLTLTCLGLALGIPSGAALIGRPVGRTAAMESDNRWTPGTWMLQAVARVMAAAKELGDKTEYGYVSRGSFLASLLKPSESSRMTYTFERGEKYVFLAAGDDDATDVDLTITDSDGHVVAKDTDSDPSAVVAFTPEETGKYTLDLKLFASRRSVASFCAVAVLRKGGYVVPIDNLSTATGRLIKSCESVWRSDGVKSLGFEFGRGEWAVFGAIIKEGEDNVVTGLQPGSGLHCYVSAADDLASDVDLYLLDSDGDTLKKDTDPDAVPRVVYRTESGSTYGLKTRAVKTEKEGASLVLTAGLEVKTVD